MNLSRPFIRRPVATTLLTVGLTLAGGVAFNLLPVSPLPQVDFPTISVSAALPGASPETMASTVATPLERALGRIAGVTEITSSSGLGSTRVTLQFDLDRNIDGAARDVQAAINAARALLPTGLPSNPNYRKVNPADAPIMILSMTSTTLPLGFLYDTGSTILAQKLSQIEGVGQVFVGGSSLPSVRVELNPDAMNQYGISFTSVRAALAAANANRPKGSIEDGDLHWQIAADDQAKKAAQYLPLIVSYTHGSPVRLSDIAEVVDSVEDLRTAGYVNGQPGIALIVFRQPGANIIETVDRVRALMPVLRNSISPSIELNVVMDRTSTIRASLHEVERTLVLSIGLVVLVVFLFLRNGRATIIPGVVVPVSLIATFGVMYLLDYSLDNLSLMALTIATGFVVDDAIVVIENITRHLDAGETPLNAALKGAQEVGFTVLSISLSLIAVFLPILLMGGIIGRLFREFAVTLSIAILISLVVSLTTTPMMCAKLLRHDPGRHGRFHRLSERGFNGLHAFYERTLRWALLHPRLMLLMLACTVGLNVYMYIIIPKGFFPQQDTGRLVGGILADQGISYQAMVKKLKQFEQIVQEDRAVESVVGYTGGSGGQRNTASMFISLKPKSERSHTADEIIARLRTKLAREPGATLFIQSVQDIRMGGRPTNAQFQYTLQGDNLDELKTWTVRLEQALKESPELLDVNSDQQVSGLQTSVLVDRNTAQRLQITPALVDATLNSAFGQSFASTIYSQMNQYHVVMEVAPRFLQSPKSLEHIRMIGANRTAIPLSAFSHNAPTNTSLSVNHQGQFAASTISFNLPKDKSLSDATRVIDAAMERIHVPPSVRGGFQGTAKAFQDSLNNQLWLILAAFATVYIVLGMLYESYMHPITILSTLPSAGLGALLALMATGVELSMIALIGIILLIGIVKKNAILMIDFALEEERSRNKKPEEAIFTACLLRFRPILMTTMAALLGALPLAFGAGDGAELRRPLGISVVGGLIVSQLLTLYTTPIVYLYLDRLRLWLLSRRSVRAHNRMGHETV